MKKSQCGGDLEYFYRVLVAPIAGATPEFKYIYLVCIKLGITTIDPWENTGAIVSRFKVNIRTFYHALKFFKESRLFDTEEVRVRGRVRCRYVRRNEFIADECARSPLPLVLHEALIHFVLFAPLEESIKVRDRMLLAALLGFADECGVVRALGVSDIASITCIGKSGVPARVEQMLKERILLTIIPGVTGTNIFRQSKSILFLNLNHALFLPAVQEYNLEQISFEYGSSDIAARLFKASHEIALIRERNLTENSLFSRLRQLRLTDYIDVIIPASRLLREHSQSEVTRYLQAKLEDYGVLIARAYALVQSPTDCSWLVGIRTLIQKDLKVKLAKGCDFGIEEALIELVVRVAEMIAREVYSAMRQSAVDPQRMTLAICSEGTSSITTLLISSPRRSVL